MSVLDDLTVEVRFYRAMHELAVMAWKKDLTVEALLSMSELVEPVIKEVTAPYDE